MITKYEDIINNADIRNDAIERIREKKDVYDPAATLNFLIKTYKMEELIVNTYDWLTYGSNDHDALWFDEPYRGEDKIPDFKAKDSNYTVDLKVFSINPFDFTDYINKHLGITHGADCLLVYNEKSHLFYTIKKYNNHYIFDDYVDSQEARKLAKEFDKILSQKYC